MGIANLKEGGAVPRNSLTAYQDFYMNMLEAESAALATDSMEVLNRRSNLLEIMHARIPDYIEKFFEEYKDGDGYQKLLDFVYIILTFSRIPSCQRKKRKSSKSTRQ